LVVLLVGCGREAGVERVTETLTVPAGLVAETVVTGLSAATAMELAPDGRIFVAEQGGKLRVVKNGALLATPFVSVPVDFEGERGLIGVTLDPAFATNGFVYVTYTSPTPAPHNRVSRFTAQGDVAVAGSEKVLLDEPNLGQALVHNGGGLHFGGDGKLYVGIGENATAGNSQSMGTLFGKLARIASDGTIPTDNPFFSTASGNNRAIWALGLRNPYTFAVQPGTGTMFINDVGNAAFEEIDRGAAGANFGWPTTEGPTTDPRFVGPIFSYMHGTTSTTGCAIVGGTFYNPATVALPASYVGKYFFSDYCGNWVRVFDPAAGTAADFAAGIPAPVDLDVGADGALYVLAHGDGSIVRIRPSSGAAPQITTQPQGVRVAVGKPATFTVAAAGAAPLTYQWQRNGAAIAGATASTYTLASAAAADSGATFRVVVSNAAGSVTSASATLTVVAGTAPVPTITTPAAGATYAAGTTVSYAGTGTDAEDGTLPASAFTWEVVFHHDTHTHPFVPPTTGATSGSFTIPTRNETSANVFYRVHLTVKDSTGLTTETTRDLLPRKSTMTFQTSPAGLSLTLDGQPLATPASVAGVVGIIRALGAPSPQTSGGVTYVFSSWSDGGAASHEISTPAAATTYTATFAPMSGGGGGTVIPPGGGVMTGTTSGASGRTAFCASASARAPEATYSWTPSVSGKARLETCGTGTKFDTVLFVAVSPAAGASQLACNDDTSGCATGDGSSTADHHGSRVSLSVTAGQTYTVVVDGYEGSVGGFQGPYVLTVTPPSGSPPPPMDAGTSMDAGTPPPPTDAGTGGGAVIPAPGGTVTGTTSGTSAASGSCAPAATASAPDATFRWTPARSGRATASTCSSQVKFDTVVYARGPTGSELACSDDVAGCATGDGSAYASQHGSRASFDVVAGQTYTIVVDGYSGSTGGSQGPFALTVTPPP
jgi:glucose/arabinose dehydrogenase